MLEIRDIHKSFSGEEVLKGIDFKVDKGEVIAVIGPSGSGKTTLLRCISFLEKADKGTIIFDGYTHEMGTISNRDIKKIRMRMGYVFQNFNLFSNMTVFENVMEGLTTARGIERNTARSKTIDVLEKVGMIDKAEYYPGEISGGQQQRVAIARAIAPDPDVILFDEPTSALDPELTGEVLDVMKRLAKEGTTMVVVTHEMGFAMDVASRITFMENGMVVEEGTSREFFSSPKEDRSRQFIRRIMRECEYTI
ncbi:MAG: amino acid ABC transporter ATP-binding protein [Lachnospiraceae bacterium]|nr:amino acid ABC transporter ATP-binding protein [Lachnospiraceae bacterium]MBR1523769.1 amino acid ABC transporter ATP-binding protein [Lachnospiraceae bacterium]